MRVSFFVKFHLFLTAFILAQASMPSYGWVDGGLYPVAVFSDTVDDSLVPYLSYLHDEKISSFNAIRHRLDAGDFSPFKHQYPSIGFKAGSHWFHFAVKNAVNIERAVLIEVDYSYLDNIEFFCFKENEEPVYFLLGDNVQYESRYVKVRNHVVPLRLAAQSKYDCLVKVVSNTHVALPIRAYDETSFVEITQGRERVLGILYGIALALFVYNLIQFSVFREKVFLYFATHVFGGVAYMTFCDGTLSRLWIRFDLQDSGVLVAIYVCAIGAIKFSSEYLELKREYKVLYQLANVGVVFALLMSCLSMFFPTLLMHVVVSVFAFSTSCFLVGCGVRRYLDDFKPAGVFLLGFGFVFLMASWMVMSTFAFHSDPGWLIYGLSVVWLAELLVLTFALSDRVSNMKLRHSDMQQQISIMESESQSKTDFMAKVSHEIRTPMNGMLGLVELLLSTPLNRDQARYINAIQNAGRGLLDVINDVLDFSRIEAGKMSLSNHVFDLNRLLSDACSIYEFDARAKKVELGCFIAPGTPLQLIGDSARIRQIILNTLSNAFNYTSKGYVHINVQLTDHIHNDKLVLRFEIEDSGVGISKDDQRKLFQSYSQIGSSSQASGTGLGLVISRQFVELMGGEMGVQSEQGAGSCFWFTIPLGMPENVEIADGAIMLDLFNGELLDNDSREPDVSLEGPIVGGGNKVLVVEDNPINQDVIKGFLQKMNLASDVVGNGRAAVEAVKSQRNYGLILMDCEMPVMDGYEASVKILKWQKSQGIPNTPIIALSAHTLEQHRKMAFDSGMVDYITKPIAYRLLQSKILAYLDVENDRN